jgi:hypothetical protein
MIYPDDLPHMLEYRLEYAVVTTLCRTPVRSISTSGDTNARIVKPRIPLGCTGWRKVGETTWRPLDTIPPNWMPFLNRERPSEMDPRPKL